MDTETAKAPRYRAMSHGNLLCRECSSPSTGYMIPGDEREDHDAWHAEQHVATTADAVVWHLGEDPVNGFLPAYRASRTEPDGTATGAVIRVGSLTSFDADGWSWEVAHNVFTWSGVAPTLEEAMDAAGRRLTTAWHGLMVEGY